MASFRGQQPTHFSGDLFPRPVPPQPQSHSPLNAEVLPAADNDRLEGHQEGIQPLVGGVAGPRRPHWPDPHHINLAHYEMAEHRPQPLCVPMASYVHSNVGLAQGTTHAQPNIPESQGHAHFDHYASQQFPLGPPQAAFPHPFLHQIPAPGQPAAENLRQFASRYLHHPDSQVDVVCVEPGTGGRCKMVIIIDMADIV